MVALLGLWMRLRNRKDHSRILHQLISNCWWRIPKSCWRVGRLNYLASWGLMQKLKKVWKQVSQVSPMRKSLTINAPMWNFMLSQGFTKFHAKGSVKPVKLGESTQDSRGDAVNQWFMHRWNLWRLFSYMIWKITSEPLGNDMSSQNKNTPLRILNTPPHILKTLRRFG